MSAAVYGAVAADYLAAGFSPLPLPPRAKANPPEHFTGRLGADPTPGQVAAWQRENPTGNVALRLPAEVVGVDVDHYDSGNTSKRGLDTLRTLEERLGSLPPTVISTSRENGSGIRLYRVPNGMALRNLGADVDTIHRGHRYVVAAPSIHPEGREYRWIDEASGEVLDRVPRIDELPELPWAWLEEFGADERDPAAERADGEAVRAFIAEHDSGEMARWLERLRTRAHDPAQASRHDTLVALACQAMREAAAGAYPAAKAVEVLRAWWLEVMDDPARRDGDEFGNAVAWAIGQATAEPEKVAEIAERVALEQWERTVPIVDPAVPPLEVLQGEPEEVDEGDAFRLADLLAVTGVVDWSSFWSEPRGEQEWIIPELVAKGRASVLYAKAKQGKSTIALAAVAAIATGRLVFGVHPSPRRRVLYLDYEMTRDDLRDRLEELGYDETADLSHLHYALLPSLRPLDTPEGAAQLVALARHYDAELVVIDTFGRAVDGPEDKSDTVRAYFRYTGAALKRAGIASLRADHAGKDLKLGQRGSSGKDDDVDLVWELTRGAGGVVNIKQTRSRITWAKERIQLRRVERNGIVEYVDTSAAEVEPDVLEVVRLLDALELPNNATNTQAREALKANGTGRSNVKIAGACSIRRRRSGAAIPAAESGNASGNVPERSSGTQAGNVTHEAGTPYAATGTALGTLGELLARERGTSRSPIGLRDVPHRLRNESDTPPEGVDPETGEVIA